MVEHFGKGIFYHSNALYYELISSFWKSFFAFIEALLHTSKVATDAQWLHMKVIDEGRKYGDKARQSISLFLSRKRKIDWVTLQRWKILFAHFLNLATASVSLHHAGHAGRGINLVRYITEIRRSIRRFIWSWPVMCLFRVLLSCT